MPETLLSQIIKLEEAQEIALKEGCYGTVNEIAKTILEYVKTYEGKYPTP